VYFVTSKRAGYALFCLTPSERAAVALTDDQQRVQLLERSGADWKLRREWPVGERSHTDLMLRVRDVEEPPTVDALLALLAAG
jgi:hypothetical protein